MPKENKKISSELAIGIILLVAIVFGILIYRAGSFSAVISYLPQKINKKDNAKKNPERILFATNGEREVYKIKKDDGKWAVEINGQEGESYDDVFDGVFSSDGSQFAYGARNGEQEFVVLNNVASDKKYKSIGQIVFDKNGKLIYKVVGVDGEFLVIDGQEGQHYTSIGEIVILDDGRVAFQAELNGQQVTVIDGQVINDNQNPGTNQGQTGEGGTGSTDGDSIPSGTDDGNDINIPVTSKKTRQKKDLVIPPTDKSYPVCNGVDCNF